MRDHLLHEAEALGVTVETFQFDGGVTVRMTHPSEDRAFSLTREWGDSIAAFEARIQKWLNTLPWPTEDDPRVQHEGAYA